jgi:hypothetical protein
MSAGFSTAPSARPVRRVLNVYNVEIFLPHLAAYALFCIQNLAEGQRKYRAFFLKNGAAWAKLDEGFFIS